ncbi:MAG: hypothetical protein [Microvirus sp.]|nr:MAG: hypothetical protein [Microvirus sp.]
MKAQIKMSNGRYVTFDPIGGKKITMPGMAVNDIDMLKRYAAGSLENQAKGFYEKNGMEIPDFDRMDRIEKLEALEHYREKLKASRQTLTNSIQDAERKHKEASEAEKLSRTKRNSGNSSDGDANGDSTSPPGGK